MDLPVLLLVIIAAAAHAGWNAWLKRSSPDLAGLAALSAGWLALGIACVPLVGFPVWASWPYLVATTVVHTLYAVVLVTAYRHGDFSLTYPIARGSGPLFVALLAPVLLREQLQGPSALAVTFIVIGILMIGLGQARAGLRDARVVLLSLATGLLIAAYTMIDGAGARSGPSAHAYTVWLFILTAGALLAVARLSYRASLYDIVKPKIKEGFFAGALSALAYWIVLWAMTLAPTALVAAVRETAILFAALISWGMLGEKLSWFRWLGVVLTVSGLVLAKL